MCLECRKKLIYSMICNVKPTKSRRRLGPFNGEGSHEHVAHPCQRGLNCACLHILSDFLRSGPVVRCKRYTKKAKKNRESSGFLTPPRAFWFNKNADMV